MKMTVTEANGWTSIDIMPDALQKNIADLSSYLHQVPNVNMYGPGDSTLWQCENFDVNAEHKNC